MKQLVPTEKEAFEVERREQMIDPGQPLRHPVVVGVFRLERELEETSGGRRVEASCASADAAVSPDPTKRWIAFADQPQANVAVRTGRLRRAVDRSDEFVVEVRGPHSELSLL